MCLNVICIINWYENLKFIIIIIFTVGDCSRGQPEGSFLISYYTEV